MNSVVVSQEIIVTGVGESPPNYEASWVERQAVQSALRERLGRDSVVEIVAGGGFGKSWLAAWGFAELEKSFDKRLWVNFRRELWQDYGFDRFARWVLQEIGFPQKDPTAQEDLLLRELIYRLNDQNRPVKTLVVMDNLESLRETADWGWFERFLQQWTEKGRNSRVLLTTRPQALTVDPLVLGGLSQEEGVVFLQREALTGERFEQLIELASGHPLLLKLAAVWVWQTVGAAVDDQAITFFCRLFERYRGDVASLAEARVESIFAEVFESLPGRWQQLLLRVSVYRLPFDLQMAQAMEESLTAEDLEGLVKQVMLVAEGERFTLHSLIREQIQAQLSTSEQEEAHQKAIAYYQANICEPWGRAILFSVEAFHHACELGQYSLADSFLDSFVDVLNRAGYWRYLLPLYQRLTQEWQAKDEAETQDLGWAWTQLGNLNLNLGNYQSAIVAYQQTQALFRSLNFLKGEAASLGNLGNAYNSLGQYQQAIELQQQSLEIQRELGDRQGEATSLGNLGNAYYSLGQYQQAIELQQQSLEIQRELGDRQGEANSLGSLGSVYRSLGQYQQAIELQQQSLEIQRELGDRQGEATSLGNLGSAYYSLGQYQQAIELQQQSLEIQRELGDRQGEAASLDNLGNVYQSLGQYQQAIELYQQSLEIQRELGDRQGEANSLGNLGSAYYSLGQYQQAIELQQQSLEIKRELGDRNGEAYSLIGLGSVYRSLGQYQQAIELYQQSLEIQRELGDRQGEANSLIGLGNVYYSLGQYQQAIELYQQSLEIQRELGNRQGEANSLIGLGNAYYSLGQYQQAIELQRQSLEIQRELGNRQGEAASLGNLGNVYDSLGQYQQAIELQQQSLEIQRELGDRQGEAASLGNLGNAYNSLGQYQQAIELQQQSLEIQRELGDRQGEANSLGNLGSVYRSLGQYQQAIELQQ